MELAGEELDLREAWELRAPGETSGLLGQREQGKGALFRFLQDEQICRSICKSLSNNKSVQRILTIYGTELT